MFASKAYFLEDILLHNFVPHSWVYCTPWMKMAYKSLYTPAVLLALSIHVLAEPIRVLDVDFPDPCLVQADYGYYAFATNGNGVNVQVASSSDFMSWGRLDGVDALPGPFPSWVASSPAIWAPDVIQRVSQNQYCKTADYIFTDCINSVGRNVYYVFLRRRRK
jgi:hypothetical protein